MKLPGNANSTYEWFIRCDEVKKGPLRVESIPEVLDLCGFDIGATEISNLSAPNCWEPLVSCEKVAEYIKPQSDLRLSSPLKGHLRIDRSEVEMDRITVGNILCANAECSEQYIDEAKTRRTEALKSLEEKTVERLSDVEMILLENRNKNKNKSKIPKANFVFFHEVYSFLLVVSFQMFLGYLAAHAHFLRPSVSQLVVFCAWSPIFFHVLKFLLSLVPLKRSFDVEGSLLWTNIKELLLTGILCFVITGLFGAKEFVIAKGGIGLNSERVEFIPELTEDPTLGEFFAELSERVDYTIMRLRINYKLASIMHHSYLGVSFQKSLAWTGFEFLYDVPDEYTWRSDPTDCFDNSELFAHFAANGFYITFLISSGLFVGGLIFHDYLLTHSSGFCTQLLLIDFMNIGGFGMIGGILILAGSLIICFHATKLIKYCWINRDML